MNIRHLLRVSKWARHPPSSQRIMILAVVLVLSLTVYGLDYFGVWPEWARTERIRP